MSFLCGGGYINAKESNPSNSSSISPNLNQTQEESEQNIQQNITSDNNSRIFIGLGLGFYHQDIKSNLGPLYEISYDANTIAAALFLGVEWIFDRYGNGLNTTATIDNQASKIRVNYVYEAKNGLGVLTGLNFGVKIRHWDSIYNWRWENSFYAGYNLGVRFRKKRHGIFLNLDIPLFSSAVQDNTGTNIIKHYDILTTMNYIYFFGL